MADIETYDDNDWKSYKRAKARAYLSYVRRVKNQLICARDELLELRDNMCATSGYHLDGMPHSHNSTDDALVNMIIAIEKRTARLNDAVYEYEYVLREADDIIGSLTCHELASAVINMHYLQEKTYLQIGNKLNYNEGSLRNYVVLISLEELYDKMPSDWRDDIPTAV